MYIGGFIPIIIYSTLAKGGGEADSSGILTENSLNILTESGLNIDTES